MKVLLLGEAQEIGIALEKAGDEVVWMAHSPISPPYVRLAGINWAVAYRYRHILRDPILSAFESRTINIHNGFLPWNRGADPNFWSWFDSTPKGVTIHHMDAGIDTGDIIAQSQTIWGRPEQETLATTYDQLHKSAIELFARMWPIIKHGGGDRTQQAGGSYGSYHRKKDFEPWEDKLPSGWDTPVEWVAEQGRRARGEQDGHRWTGA